MKKERFKSFQSSFSNSNNNKKLIIKFKFCYSKYLAYYSLL